MQQHQDVKDATMRRKRALVRLSGRLIRDAAGSCIIQRRHLNLAGELTDAVNKLAFCEDSLSTHRSDTRMHFQDLIYTPQVQNASADLFKELVLFFPRHFPLCFCS